jgi:hypothetical protein
MTYVTYVLPLATGKPQDPIFQGKISVSRRSGAGRLRAPVAPRVLSVDRNREIRAEPKTALNAVLDNSSLKWGNGAFVQWL